jgi:hypothetical protein
VADDVNTAVEARTPENDSLIWNLSRKSRMAIEGRTSENSLPSNLTNYINMASKAHAPESDNLSMDRENPQIMKGSQIEGYCDVTGRARDLYLVGMFSILSCSLTSLQRQFYR